MKIVVVSDNHTNYSVLNKILNDNPDADYYLHLGDSEMEKYELRPFVSVRGNVDFDYDYPIDRIIDIGNHSIFMTHGNAYSADLNLLSRAGKMNDCDIVLCGHTHVYLDTTINGVRIINPGSCSRPKDGTNGTYCIINIDKNNEILVKRVEIKR